MNAREILAVIVECKLASQIYSEIEAGPGFGGLTYISMAKKKKGRVFNKTRYGPKSQCSMAT